MNMRRRHLFGVFSRMYALLSSLDAGGDTPRERRKKQTKKQQVKEGGRKEKRETESESVCECV